MDYFDYYEREVASRGINATLLAHWPRLAAGLGGDIFHAVIQLGYAFEAAQLDNTAQSGEGALVAQGLAWSSTAFAELPGGRGENGSGAAWTQPLEALHALRLDPHPFPNYTWQDEVRS